MPVDVEWCIEGTLLWQRFSGIVTVEHLRQANKRLDDFTRVYPPNNIVHLLIDQSDPDLKLPELHELVRVSQPFEDIRFGSVALVKSPHLVTQKLGTIALTVISRLLEFRLRSFHGVEDALKFLADSDERIARWHQDYLRGRV